MSIQEHTKLSLAQIERLTAFRRELHAHPEVSGGERETARRITEYLRKLNPDELLEEVGGTGVVAIFNGKKSGQSILFRADMDALPIQEINHFEHRSKTDGVSHKCGHDGHTTCLLGMAELLTDERPAHGRAVLLFQPAEETGSGARAVMADKFFQKLNIDEAYAFHNLPGYPLGQIVVKNGAFTAAVKSLIIKLHGKTAHAAEPEHGDNPALAIAEILNRTNQLSNNAPGQEDFAVVTPVHVNLGDKNYGISAGYGEVHLTIRTWAQAELVRLENKVLSIVDGAKKRFRLRAEVSETQVFHANENDRMAVEKVKTAARENSFDLAERPTPFKWGEDFGLFTQQYRGAMFGIGSGEDCPALHNPDYDFPDELIPLGAAMFHEILRQKMKE